MNTRNDPKNARIRGKSGPDENGPETVVAHLPGASSTAPLNQPGGTMTEDQSTQIQIHLPPISDDRISNDLVDLTEALAKAGADISGGFLGGEYGYGAYFENDTFMMHPYCWCGRSDCAWCVSCECGDDADQYFVRGTNEYLEVGFEAWLKAYDPDDHDARKSHRVTENLCDLCSGRVEPAPNFLHKSSGSKVRWYKYIGRGMEVDLKADWRTIFAECVESVGS